MATVIHHSSPSTSAVYLPESRLSHRHRSFNLRSLPKPEISSFLSPSRPRPSPKPQNHRLPQQFRQSQPLLNSKPPYHDYTLLLRLSARYDDAELAKTVHASILKLLLQEEEEGETRLYNALISAYIKLGELDCAYRVLQTVRSPDVVTHTALISGFAKSNREREAIGMFMEMRLAGIEPNEFSFVALLSACMRLLDYKLGSQVHAYVIKMGFLDDTIVANAMMGLYNKCSCLNSVLKLFDEMPHRDTASWNTVISCLVKECLYDEVFRAFSSMRADGVDVDYFTLSSLLAACSGGREGWGLHAHSIKVGYGNSLSVNNALIGFYGKCGKVEDVMDLFERMVEKDVYSWTGMITACMEFGLVDHAVQLFQRMPEKNCVSYNALLAGFCRNDQGLNALGLFAKMVERGVELNDFTLTTAVNACTLIKQKEISEQIHGFVLKFGLGRNYCMESALLDSCTWCGRMSDAEKMFLRWPSNWDKSVVLTSLVCGYSRNRQLEEAISLICLGLSEQSLVLDEVAVSAILSICGTLGFIEFGEQMHAYSIKSGFQSDTQLGNATISMYSKCGNMKDAVKVCDDMVVRDVVSWNSLLDGYVSHRQGDEALAVWRKMEKLRIRPDSITCIFVITAYRHTSSNLVDSCRVFFHSLESIHQIKPSSEHYASFVSVLGYWGLLEEAEQTVRRMPFVPNASVWRALLDSCRIHRNSTIGRRVIKEILSLDPQDPSAFILKSNLYSASARWHCAEIVREQMKEKGFQKFPGRSRIILKNKVHSFYARDNLHPQSKDIHRGLKILILECLKAGYAPDTSFVLHEAEEHQKEDFLFQHSAKLALTYGLLMTPAGKPLRITKNIVLCGDCHTFYKIVSVVTRRVIYVRDTSGFHCFSDGKCSCKDHW